MLGESRLNVYVLGSELSRRQRERIQAQVQTGFRSLPPWLFDLLRQRLDALGLSSLPLIIEPQPATSPHRVLSLGRIESRPAVKLTPALAEDRIDWGQDLPHLLAKAIAFVIAPDDAGSDFWCRWRDVVREDLLREKASALARAYEDETDLGLLIEMLAAYALKPAHRRWSELTRVQAFFEQWRSGAG